MALDACLALVESARDRRPWSLVERMVGRPLQRFALHVTTPHARIVEAVEKEIRDLSVRAEEAVNPLAATAGRAAETATTLLRDARAADRFPREELSRMNSDARGDAPLERLSATIGEWVARHEQLERRLQWLLDPTLTGPMLDRLDATEDADQIWCFVRYEFRPEVLYALWGNAIERIAQVEAASTFFHSTGKAEGIPVKRTEDTALFYAYLFNWGADSYHGRKAVEGMNRIHGRYFIHNDGLKYVLLNAAFTILDGLALIGHRPLREKERLGYFHAQIEMGKAMNIQGLSHSWDEMYGWFHDLNRAFAAHAPQKLRAWEAIESGFDRALAVPKLISTFRKLAERASMDDTYLSSLGFERPSKGKTAFVRGVMRAVARARRLLPSEPYIQSLQSYNSYPDGGRVEAIGEKERSERMPSVCPFAAAPSPRPNKGYPENQRPLLDASAAENMELATLTWDEVAKHSTEEDLWLVWGGHVYDLSAFAKNHPGGLKILLGGVGRDMTKPFEKAKHTDLTKVFALNFRIGKIESRDPPARRPARAGETASAGRDAVTASSETR
jgi:cytochrome b involved in lipid metabolism